MLSALWEAPGGGPDWGLLTAVALAALVVALGAAVAARDVAAARRGRYRGRVAEAARAEDAAVKRARQVLR